MLLELMDDCKSATWGFIAQYRFSTRCTCRRQCKGRCLSRSVAAEKFSNFELFPNPSVAQEIILAQWTSRALTGPNPSLEDVLPQIPTC